MSPCRKIRIFAALMAAVLVTFIFPEASSADMNLLANGDFRDGIKAWGGTPRIPKQSDWFNGANSNWTPTNSVVLDPGPYPQASSWMILAQDFISNAETYSYSITYEFSNDYEPINNPPEPTTFISTVTSNFLVQVTSGRAHGNLAPPGINEFAVLILDRMGGTVGSDFVRAAALSATSHTAAGTIGLKSQSDKKTVYFVFHSGKGLIRVSNASVSASNDLAPPPPL
jgi:hypothetical protein